jgi:hypothetical protein
MAEQINVQTSIQFRRVEDFISRYANNVHFEISVWDLKLLFSELQQPPGEPAFVQQHTAITLPWVQVKLLALLLQVNIVAHETANGKIIVPANLLPPVSPPGPEITDPQARAVLENMFNKFQELIAEL